MNLVEIEVVGVVIVACLWIYKMTTDTSSKINQYLQVIEEEQKRVDALEFFATFGFKVDEYDRSKDVIILDKIQNIQRDKLTLLDRTLFHAVGKHLSDIRVAHNDVNSPDI